MQKNAVSLSGLYAVTDARLMPAEQLLIKAEAALRGGCRALQYRNKSADQSQCIKEATELRRLCSRYQVFFIINDDLALALAVKADGVHIGQQDGNIAEIKKQLPPQMVLGVSCHGDLALALQAQEQGADYVAFGRFFDSHTKPQASIASLDIIKQAKQQLRLPVVAIGGITRDNAPLLIKQGADMIAVIHDLFSFDNVEERTKDFCSLFN